MDNGGVGTVAVWGTGACAAGTNGALNEMVVVGGVVADGSGSRVGNTGSKLFAGRLMEFEI